MFKKAIKQRQSTWSNSMKEYILKHLIYGAHQDILFTISSKDTSISLDKNTFKESISYKGHIEYADTGLENVGVFINCSDYLTENYPDHIGYIEMLDGIHAEEPVPMIRGYIQKDSSYHDVINKLLVENKIFGSNKLITTSLRLDITGIIHTQPDQILNIKIPIKSLDIYLQHSFL